jgi:hypothetical protein
VIASSDSDPESQETLTVVFVENELEEIVP